MGTIPLIGDDKKDSLAVNEEPQNGNKSGILSGQLKSLGVEGVSQAEASVDAQGKANAAASEASTRGAEAERKAQERAAAEKQQQEQAAQQAAQQAQQAQAPPQSSNPAPAPPPDCASYFGNKQIGCSLVVEAGLDMNQMSCLEKLWDKESGWRIEAANSSGAYGIPQALPGSKMAAFGDDWQTNAVTQIRWGLSYISGRYSTPCGAWSTFQAQNWY